MNRLIFGRGDDLYFTAPMHIKSPFGSSIAYTSPQIEWFYSKYGFAIPTTYEAIPYEVVLEKALPPIPENVRRFSSMPSYILVDANESIWYASHGHENDEPAICHQYVYNDGTGWWIHSAVEGSMSEAEEMMLGYLSTDPEPQTIHDFAFMRMGGMQLTHLKLSDISKRIKRHDDLGNASENKKDEVVTSSSDHEL